MTGALRLGAAVSLLDLADELVRILELALHVVQQDRVVLAVREIGRDLPHVEEPPVAHHHLASAIDDQRAFRGRFDGGLKQREQPLPGLRRLGQLRDVPARSHQPDRLPFGIDGHVATRVKRPNAAVRSNDSMIVAEGPGVTPGLEHHPPRQLHVLPVDLRQKRLDRPAELPRLESVDPIELVRPGDHVRADLPLEAPHVSRSLRLAQTGFTERQARLGRRPFRDTERRSHATHDCAPGAAHRFDEDRVPALPVTILERLALASERRQVVGDSWLCRIARSEEVLDALSHDLARTEPRGIDEAPGDVGEREVAIDRPDHPRYVAKDETQQGALLLVLLTGSLPREHDLNIRSHDATGRTPRSTDRLLGWLHPRTGRLLGCAHLQEAGLARRSLTTLTTSNHATPARPAPKVNARSSGWRIEMRNSVRRKGT